MLSPTPTYWNAGLLWASSQGIKARAGAGGRAVARARAGSLAGSFGIAARSDVGGSTSGGRERSFSSTARRPARAATLDHYSTLGVARGATQAQIKSQFYKLSKEFHPDVNPSDDAKRRFQEVSEAYATLGSAGSRRAYDRDRDSQGQSSSYYGGYGDNVGRGSGYAYDPNDNVNRRARATYAWEYQRRRRAGGPSSPGSGSASGGFYGDASASSSGSGAGMGRQTHSSIFNDAFTHTGSSSTSSTSAFEKLAAQQRAREERNRARQSGSAASRAEESAYQADVANPIVRFAQVVVTLYIVFKAGTFFVDRDQQSSRSPNSQRRT
ncbi:DnaJ-domain-containing protein [Testicularia cyperi]|uniref:DnaJ-domain-containing protein n=1 Tax=Testicularia cyperi TaxID=1882483 RepID=A0A317XS54_9BASI|nr:DnaJ-domain-containing protein [Testicularia cyperi]